MKFLDTQLAVGLGFASNSWTIAANQLLNGCAPGSTANTRIGRKFTMKSVLIRYNFSMATTTTGGGPLRIVVVYDKQSNAAIPAVTDIFTTDDIEALNNLSNRDRFIIIADHYTEVIGVQSAYSVSGVIKRKINLETMFNTGTAGTVADITTGSLYIMFGTPGLHLTAGPTLSFQARVRFSDL